MGPDSLLVGRHDGLDLAIRNLVDDTLDGDEGARPALLSKLL